MGASILDTYNGKRHQNRDDRFDSLFSKVLFCDGLGNNGTIHGVKGTARKGQNRGGCNHHPFPPGHP
ncbi:Uncharacterised protein [Chlamydia trachomatis]|nr:Uncharacterised protein [Chlamydia trachomatis]